MTTQATVNMTAIEVKAIAMLDDILASSPLPDAEFVHYLAYVAVGRRIMTPDGRKRLWSIAMYHLPTTGRYNAKYATRHLETLRRLKRVENG